MKKTGSDYVIMDCVRLNHCKKVVEFLKKNGIDAHPSGAMIFRPFRLDKRATWLDAIDTDSKALFVLDYAC